MLSKQRRAESPRRRALCLPATAPRHGRDARHDWLIATATPRYKIDLVPVVPS